MARLTPQQYDALERAIDRGTRIAVYRRGTELVVTPTRLRQDGSRETLEAVHPSTGQPISWRLDDIDAIEVVA